MRPPQRRQRNRIDRQRAGAQSAAGASGAFVPEAEAEPPEMEVFYTFTWAPRPRGNRHPQRGERQRQTEQSGTQAPHLPPCFASPFAGACPSFHTPCFFKASATSRGM